VDPLTDFHFNGRLLALPANISLGWKQVAVANTLAYYGTATITTVKGFIVQDPTYGLLRAPEPTIFYKTFFYLSNVK
jgi:hypothetical protein